MRFCEKDDGFCFRRWEEMPLAFFPTSGYKSEVFMSLSSFHLLGLWQFLNLALFSMTLKILVRYFVDWPSIWFSLIFFGRWNWVLGRNSRPVSPCSYVEGMRHQHEPSVMVTGHLSDVVPSGHLYLSLSGTQFTQTAEDPERYLSERFHGSSCNSVRQLLLSGWVLSLVT